MLPQGTAEEGPKLDLQSGETKQMDWLGPLVVAETGQLQRIANWAKMTEQEKQVALRRICKRNKERIDALRSQGKLAAPCESPQEEE